MERERAGLAHSARGLSRQSSSSQRIRRKRSGPARPGAKQGAASRLPRATGGLAKLAAGWLGTTAGGGGPGAVCVQRLGAMTARARAWGKRVEREREGGREGGREGVAVRAHARRRTNCTAQKSFTLELKVTKSARR